MLIESPKSILTKWLRARSPLGFQVAMDPKASSSHPEWEKRMSSLDKQEMATKSEVFSARS